MRYYVKLLAAFLFAVFLAGCGGGGGSPGTNPGGGGGNNNQPQITVELLDATGASTTSISSAGQVTAKATVRTATGGVVAGTKVTFSGDESLIKFTPSATTLTDAAGVATVQVSSASLTAAGAGTLSAEAAIAGATVSGKKDFQVAAANLVLSALDFGAPTLPAFGNRPVSVVARVNGVPVAVPVQITFAASCGTVSPVSVATDASGRAATTYKADSASCSGSNVTLSATAAGANAVTGTIAVQPALATNIQFVSATPQLIYLAGSVGATQAQVAFKVVDATGSPLQNQAVQFSLANSGPGVSLNTVGNIAPVTLTTDSVGVATVAVFSGTVPTSVQIRAVLVSNGALVATSNVLTVASGRAVQRATSIALSKLSIEGFRRDGATSDVTISLADRQGNPVPDGTEVNFVSESGVMIPPRCVVTGGTSSCTVVIRSQGTHPANGRISILAYLPGEEDFVDANFNNVYDPGETFTDLGNAYRDDNEDGDYTVGEFTVPRAGSLTCFGGPNGRPNTCDGSWGTVDVRAQAVIVFATSNALISTTAVTTGEIQAVIADENGNSMPTGSVISAERLSGSTTCAVTKVSQTIVPNRLGPLAVAVVLNQCVTNDRILITVTSPAGLVSSFPVTLP